MNNWYIPEKFGMFGQCSYDISKLYSRKMEKHNERDKTSDNTWVEVDVADIYTYKCQERVMQN